MQVSQGHKTHSKNANIDRRLTKMMQKQKWWPFLCLFREKIALALLNDFFQLNSSPNISPKEIARSQRGNKDFMFTQNSLGHLGSHGKSMDLLPFQ